MEASPEEIQKEQREEQTLLLNSAVNQFSVVTKQLEKSIKEIQSKVLGSTPGGSGGEGHRF